MGILLVFILLSHNHLNMQTELISADTKNRAKSAGLRTPHFRRMLSLVWPHRRFVLLGLIGSVFYGFLHSMGIVAVLPVLKVILSDEGLHSWVDRSITEERLDLDLDIRSRAQDSEALGSRLVIIKMPDGSPLFEIDAKPFDAIDAFALSSGDEGGEATAELESIAPASFLQSVAAAEPGAHLTMTTRSAGDGALSQSITIQLKQASTHWRIAGWAAEFVPRAQQRGGRVVALYWVLGFMVVVNILSNLARFVAQYFIAVGVLRSVMDMRRQLYRKIL